MIKAGIYGATGYTGWELVQLLQRHPAADIAFATSQSQAGQTLRDVFPTRPPCRSWTEPTRRSTTWMWSFSACPMPPRPRRRCRPWPPARESST